MFTNIDETLSWVMNRRKSFHEYSDYRSYIDLIGNPQRKLKCIHVAGTNGKGSTTNYIRSILQAAGYKVGSFTSPHLVTHLDRIRINDVNIDENYFIDICNKYKEEWDEHDLSMFEIDMIISINYFLDNNVDYVVYEVGLGGRLDATNIIDPIGSVITNIEMDHMRILGDTIEKIAYEKAGIIKEGLTVVTFEKKGEAVDVFKKVIEEKHGNLILTDEPKNVVVTDHIEYDYKNHHLSIPNQAVYQCLNSSAAVELIDYLNEKELVKVSEEDILNGLQCLWAGRFERVSLDPEVIIDGAHNDNGVEKLCASLDALDKEYVIVFSALRDKEYKKMLAMLVERGEVIVTEFENARKETAENLAYGFDVKAISDYNKAIEYALNTNKTVIITGSLYFISIVREMFKK